MLTKREFEDFIKEIESIENLNVKSVKSGRFVEEFNIDVSVKCNSYEQELLTMKVFLGRKPYYGEWIEIFGISKEFCGKSFFGSEIEGKILDTVSKYFPKVFIEYFEDKETAKELQKGVPPALSRLGYELLKRKYTYFRDWYIPEGLMEGGHKIQAERPKSEDVKRKHIKSIKEEYESFLKSCGDISLIEKVKSRYNSLEWERL